MADELDAFYRYSSSVIEPWDGPAAMVFSDGRVLGACLDRNGLRPGRWLVTDEGVVVLGSEAGVLPVDPAKVVRRGRLHPGRLFVVDLERKLLQADGEAELEVAARKPIRPLVRRGRDPDDRPRARARSASRPSRCALASWRSATARRTCGCYLAGGRGRDRADRLDGQRPRARGALGARAVAVQLLQAALRPGHQPADRLGARVDRDEPRVADRLRGQHALRGPRARDPARAEPPGADQRGARADRPRLAPLAARDDPRRDLAARRRAPGPRGRARPDRARGERRDHRAAPT